MRRTVAGVHGVLAALHVYWATGTTWPAGDERSLSLAVLGGPVSFRPGVVLPLAVLHLVLAAAILTSERWKPSRLVVAGLAAGLAARATAGLVWITGAGDLSTAFYWLNLLLYTPLCIGLCAADLKMLRARWLRSTVVIVSAAVVIVVALLGQAARFGDLLPNATVRVLPGCGHALSVDCADQVTPLLAAFPR